MGKHVIRKVKVTSNLIVFFFYATLETHTGILQKQMKYRRVFLMDKHGEKKHDYEIYSNSFYKYFNGIIMTINSGKN